MDSVWVGEKRIKVYTPFIPTHTRTFTHKYIHTYKQKTCPSHRPTDWTTNQMASRRPWGTIGKIYLIAGNYSREVMPKNCVYYYLFSNHSPSVPFPILPNNLYCPPPLHLLFPHTDNFSSNFLWTNCWKLNKPFYQGYCGRGCVGNTQTETAGQRAKPPPLPSPNPTIATSIS